MAEQLVVGLHQELLAQKRVRQLTHVSALHDQGVPLPCASAAGPVPRRDQLGPQQFAAPVQTRHHRADRHLERGRDFLVGHLLNVAEQDHFLMVRGNLLQGQEHVFVGQAIGNRRHERHDIGRPLIEARVDRRAPLLALSIRPHMVQDRHQPRTAVGPHRESMEGLQRLHQRLLDQILGFSAIADEPHRVAEQPVHVRHGFGFERKPAAIRVGVRRQRLIHAGRSTQRQSRSGVTLFHRRAPRPGAGEGVRERYPALAARPVSGPLAFATLQISVVRDTRWAELARSMRA